MFFDRLTRYRIEAIYLNYRPSLCLGIQTGTPLVGFGTFASHLVFGGDPEPDADALLIVHSLCIHRAPLALHAFILRLPARSVSPAPALRPPMLPAGLQAVVRGHSS